MRAADVDVEKKSLENARQIIAVGPVMGRRLGDACDATILLDRGWFGDCLR